MNPRSYWPLLLAALTYFTATSFSQTAAPAGDELGMARTLGHATWTRCAAHLAYPSPKATSCPMYAQTPCPSHRSQARLS